MRLTFLLTLAVGLLGIGPAPTGGPANGDKERLQGTWVLRSVEANGTPLPLEEIQGGKLLAQARLVVKGDGYTFTLAEGTYAMTFRMDPEKKPRAIDMTITHGPEKGKTYHGIYELSGNTYKICRHAELDKPRPTAFVTTRGSGQIIVTWQREKL
jgi:uncharacterized protein (TIGR03067 family)